MRTRFYILLAVLTVAIWPSARTNASTPLTLDSCIAMAKRNNPDLRRAELNIRKAEEVKAQAMTKYFPQVRATAFGYHALHPLVEIGIDDIGNASVRDLLTTLYGNYGAALGLDNTLSLFQYGYTAGVTAVQPVFMGGKIIAGNRLAQVGVEAAKLQAEIDQRDRLGQVEESYWMLYGLAQKQHIIDDANLLLDTLYQTVEMAVEAGLALPADLLQVEIRRDDIAHRQMQLQSGMRLARRALALAIGLEVSDTIVIADDTIATSPVPAMPQQSFASPESRLLDLQLRAEQLKRRMALADALPQLAVGANYSYGHLQTNLLRDGIRSRTGNGAVFVTLNVPLTGWWETAHRLRELDYSVEQARLQADHLNQQLQLRDIQAYDQLTSAEALVQIRQRTLAHAQEAYRQMQTNYEAGLATIAELLQAQMALTQAQSDLTDARIALRVSTRRYRDLTHTE